MLGELRDTLSTEQQQRFSQIKADFVRLNKLDGAGSPVMMAVEQMGYLHQSLEEIASKLSKNNLSHDYSQLLQSLGVNLQSLDNKQAINSIAQSLDNKEAMNALTAAVTSNNNQVSFAQLVNAINQQTQGINSNNVQAQFEKLIAAWGAK